MGKSQPTVSHHLSLLADAGLITKEKVGRWVNCTVVPERLGAAARRPRRLNAHLGRRLPSTSQSTNINNDADRCRYTVDAVKALAEPLRWRIVELLATEELCVCHLVEELDVPQPLVSHHLKVLRDAGLVDSERFRYWTYYRLRAEALTHLAAHVGTRRRAVADARPANADAMLLSRWT